MAKSGSLQKTVLCIYQCILPFPLKGSAYKVHFFKGKAIPEQAWTSPEGYRRLRLPDFLENRHMRVVRLSALSTDRLYALRSYSR